MLIPIQKVIVRDRIRKDYGDIKELADDIRENGLINPPVVNKEYELLAGERRLKACKSLGWEKIPVTMMDTRDAEHELNIEISENDVRKGFSKAERADYMKRLLKIEQAKASERMKDPTKNSSEGESRQIVSKQFGISHDTMRKEIEIVKNKDLLDPSDFADWDEGKLSTNKMYQKLKRESAEKDRKIRELESREPEVKTVVKEVVPSDYKEAKNKAKAYDAETKRLNQKLTESYNKRNELEEEIRSLQEQTVREQTNNDFIAGAIYFIAQCGSFIRDVGGYVWIADKLADLPEKDREGYIKAAMAVRDWAVVLLNNIERSEYGKQEIERIGSESN